MNQKSEPARTPQDVLPATQKEEGQDAAGKRTGCGICSQCENCSFYVKGVPCKSKGHR